MATFDTTGVVLDAIPYRDRHVILALITPDRGHLRGVWRHARGGRAPQASASQVLSAVECSAYRGPNADMVTFRTVDLVRSSFPLASTITGASAAAAIAETLAAFCPLEEPAPRRYRLARASLEALLGGVPVDAVVSYVQFWCLRFGGFLPDGDAAEDWAQSGPRALSADELQHLGHFLHTPPTALESVLPRGLTTWLDDAVRIHAELPLRALAFHRRMASDEVSETGARR